MSEADSDHAPEASPPSDATVPAPATETPAATEPAAPAKRKRLGALGGVLGFVAALGAGFFIGQWIRNRDAAGTEAQGDERYKVELRGDEPQLGPDDALVTIVEFADYQCPYCAKAVEPLEAAMRDHEGDVRLLFKHYPLPSHRQATPAAKAAWAAHQQGKFWEMHRRMFDRKGDLGAIDADCAELGLDCERLEADLSSTAAAEAIDADFLAGGKVGVHGTPAFFVNGHRFSGLKQEGQWREIIERELADARRLVDDGTARANVYATLMEDALTSHAGGITPKGQSRGGLDPAAVYRVPDDGRPALGPADALVTVVVFSDFQCPYCERLGPTVHALVQEHPDVRVVFRNLPLPMHKRAREAALATLAADRQGKFWEMHDKLFAAQAELPRADFAAFAQELGLDVDRFRTDMEDPALAQRVAEDEAAAARIGVRSTPSSFINGRWLGGAQPPAAFGELIAEERIRAQARVDAGTARDRVYAEIVASGIEAGAAGGS